MRGCPDCGKRKHLGDCNEDAYEQHQAALVDAEPADDERMMDGLQLLDAVETGILDDVDGGYDPTGFTEYFFRFPIA